MVFATTETTKVIDIDNDEKYEEMFTENCQNIDSVLRVIQQSKTYTK